MNTKNNLASVSLFDIFRLCHISWLWLVPAIALGVFAALFALTPLVIVYGYIYILIGQLDIATIEQASSSWFDSLFTLRTLPMVFLATFFCLGIAGLLQYFSHAWCGWLASRLSFKLRKILAQRFTNIDMQLWRVQGSLLFRQKLDDSLAQIVVFISRQFPALVRGICVPLCIVASMWFVNWQLSLLALLPIPLAIATVVISVRTRAAYRLKDRHSETRSALRQRVIEYFASLPAMRLFGQENSKANVNRTMESFANFMREWIAVMTPPWARYYAFVSHALLPLLVFGIWLHGKGMISLQDMLLFSLLGLAYIRPLFVLGNSSSQLVLVKQAFADFVACLPSEQLAQPAHIGNDDTQGHKPSTLQSNQNMPQSLSVEPIVKQTKFTLRNVSWYYGKHQVLHNIDLQLPASGCIGVVGPSGAGKSTLAYVLSGVLEAKKGEVFLGDRNLANIPREERNNSISIVSQHSYIFDDTLATNVTLSAAPNVSRLQSALEKVQLATLVQTFPQGIYTNIGKKGVALSGGQRQRLHVARALYAQTPIVILDEATAFVDPDNEFAITQAIASLAPTLLIVITHRLASLQHADMLIMLDRGRIVDTGTHKQLYSRCIHYAALWQAQQSPHPLRLTSNT